MITKQILNSKLPIVVQWMKAWKVYVTKLSEIAIINLLQLRYCPSKHSVLRMDFSKFRILCVVCENVYLLFDRTHLYKWWLVQKGVWMAEDKFAQKKNAIVAQRNAVLTNTSNSLRQQSERLHSILRKK